MVVGFFVLSIGIIVSQDEVFYDAIIGRIQFDESEGSVNLFRKESSRINKEFDLLKTDFDALFEGLKKSGLKLNVDIF